MSMYLRALGILLFMMQAYTFHETLRIHYRTTLQSVAVYAAVAFLMILVSPWLSPLVVHGMILVVLILLILLYKDHYLDHLLFLGSYVIAGYLIYVLSGGFLQPDQKYFIWLIGCIVSGIASGIQLLYLAKKNEHYDQIYATPFIIAFFLYVLLALHLLNTVRDSDGLAVVCMQVLFMLFLYFYRVCFTLEVSREKELLAMKKTHRAVENRERYDRIQKENAYIMKSMHDLRKHMELLSQMKEGGEIVETYRQRIQQQSEQMLAIQKSGDELIDKVLQLYQPRFHQAGIRFQLESDVINYAFMDPVDRCAILCNLFDNALKSCQYVKEPFLLFRMVKQQHTIIWKMKNSCTHVEEEDEEAFAHGFGMENVRDIVHRYQGSLSAVYEEEHHIFKTTVILVEPLMSENEPLV